MQTLMNRFSFCLGFIPLALVTVACSGEAPTTSLGKSAEPIIGGVTDTGAAAHDGVVFLSLPGGYACSGSLIAPKLVITARHCVSQNVSTGIGCDIYGTSQNGDHVGADLLASGIRVKSGANPGATLAHGAQILHPAGNNLCNNDIGLIVLDTAITSLPIVPIRLDWAPQIGELATAVGYGETSDNAGYTAGTRRRRDNVPVLSVGQDWNKLIGAGELAAGQGICSGDSGGPLIAASGAIIGLASRSAACSNPSDTPIYTRVDTQKALIMQAFAAAGATPVGDPGTPPTTTPKKKATGDSPCKTGAECASFLCQTNGGYCDDFCANVSCPTGMYCADTSVTLSGQVVNDKFCEPIPTGGGCDTCRLTNCVNTVSSCEANPDCKTLLGCVDKCTDAACLSACKAASPNGADDYSIVEYCSCQQCPTECGDMCLTGTGGAGGAAGASGTGGASGAAGSSTAGTGGAAGSNAADAGTTPTAGDSGSAGGCSTTGKRAPASGWIALSLIGLAFWRRRR